MDYAMMEASNPASASDEVRRNAEITGDQLQDARDRISQLQAPMLMTSSSSTQSSSCSLGFLEEDFICYYDGLNSRKIEQLKSIALTLSSQGGLAKLVQVYVEMRKSSLNKGLKRLWKDKLNGIDIQRLEWTVLERKIMYWIGCNLTIFEYEKRLSNQIFGDFGDDTYGSCFIGSVEDSATRLFDYARRIGFRPQPPESRLKMMLLLYRTFSDLMPRIQTESEKARWVQDQAGQLLVELAKGVNSTLSEFENAVGNDRRRSKDSVPGQMIHSLAEFVMDYITSPIMEYREILNDLITAMPSNCSEFQRRSPLEAHLLWILKALKQNLEEKSKTYEDPKLSCLFMTSNIRYIDQQIHQSEVLRNMVGNDHLKIFGLFGDHKSLYSR